MEKNNTKGIKIAVLYNGFIENDNYLNRMLSDIKNFLELQYCPRISRKLSLERSAKPTIPEGIDEFS